VPDRGHSPKPSCAAPAIVRTKPAIAAALAVEADDDTDGGLVEAVADVEPGNMLPVLARLLIELADDGRVRDARSP
jgi:hypothetical protein